jgi:hypothetical protein
MNFQISQNTLAETIKRKIFDGFGKEAIKATGINGLNEEPISFEILNGEEFVGAIVVQQFWGSASYQILICKRKLSRPRDC